MTRLHGWAPRCRRLVDKVPHGHWKTSTFLAALRNDRIDAPCFRRANQRQALSRLCRAIPGPDPQANASSSSTTSDRTRKAVRAAIKEAGAHLPKYSPDLNHRVFAKLETRAKGPPHAPSTPFQTPSPTLCAPYPRKNAQTISETQGMNTPKRRTR
jgi:hypothetical protein